MNNNFRKNRDKIKDMKPGYSKHAEDLSSNNDGSETLDALGANDSPLDINTDFEVQQKIEEKKSSVHSEELTMDNFNLDDSESQIVENPEDSESEDLFTASDVEKLVDEYETRIEDLENKLQNEKNQREEDSKKFNEQIDVLKTSLEDKDNELKEYQESIHNSESESTQEYDELKTRIGSLEQTLSKKNEELEKALEDESLAQQEIDRLNNQSQQTSMEVGIVENLKAQLNERNEKIEHLEKSNESLNEDIIKLNQDLKEFESDDTEEEVDDENDPFLFTYNGHDWYRKEMLEMMKRRGPKTKEEHKIIDKYHEFNALAGNIDIESTPDRVLDFVMRKTVENLAGNYKSDTFVQSYSDKIFQDYAKDEVDETNPLFKALIKEVYENDYEDDYLGSDMTKVVMGYVGRLDR